MGARWELRDLRDLRRGGHTDEIPRRLWVGWESTWPQEWSIGTFDGCYSTRIELRDSGEAAEPQVGYESNHYWIPLVITKA